MLNNRNWFKEVFIRPPNNKWTSCTIFERSVCTLISLFSLWEFNRWLLLQKTWLSVWKWLYGVIFARIYCELYSWDKMGGKSLFSRRRKLPFASIYNVYIFYFCAEEFGRQECLRKQRFFALFPISISKTCFFREQLKSLNKEETPRSPWVKIILFHSKNVLENA